MLDVEIRADGERPYEFKVRDICVCGSVVRSGLEYPAERKVELIVDLYAGELVIGGGGR
jgi:hypothetical protein